MPPPIPAAPPPPWLGSACLGQSGILYLKLMEILLETSPLAITYSVFNSYSKLEEIIWLIRSSEHYFIGNQPNLPIYH